MSDPSGPGARVLLFTGKGGVGKTTVAAATALACAARGQRTVVVSTDPAHSLADALAVPVGGEPIWVAEHLWAAQLDARISLTSSVEELRSWLGEVLTWAGMDPVAAEELATLPGLDELVALTDIAALAAAGRWDTVVVDCAPTADTLRLLALPDVLAWWMARAFPLGRRITRLLAPALRVVTGVPLASEAALGATEQLYARLGEVKRLLADRQVTRIRLVVTPEHMVVAEARRTATALALFDYGVDAVVANRILPAGVVDPWFTSWREAHARTLVAIEEGFAPAPVLPAELAPTEVVGIPALEALGASLYGQSDPAEARCERRALSVKRVEGGYDLVLELPFVAPEDLELGRRDGELVLEVAGRRRALLLPDSLARRAVAGATLQEGCLVVRFADPRT